MTSILTLLTISDSVLIVHAPVGCTGCASFMNTSYIKGQTLRGVNNPKNARWTATNLDEKDIIHGGEEKLKNVIIQMERRHSPKLIFVLTSCASAIIGDDVDSIVSQIQPTINARLIPIHCEGFKTKVTATGYDVCYKAILDHILEKPNEKEPDLVNILNPFSFNKKDQNELARLLSELGLKSNFVPCYSSIEGLKSIAKASVSTSVCQVHAEYFVGALKDKYGIPYTKHVMPLGIENTDNWILEIAAILNKEKEAKILIEKEHQRIKSEVDELKSILKGKKVFISGGPARTVTIAALADELGFEVVGLHAFHYDEIISDNIKSLTEKLGDFVFDVANMQPFEQANLIERLKPDIFIGNGTWVPKQGIPSAFLIDQLGNSLGYEGVLAIGRKLTNALENPGFAIKLSQHAKLPYRNEWFNQNPFKYLKVAGGSNNE
jgi:nitrogenase molybdenum-iron protein alpha chain